MHCKHTDETEGMLVRKRRSELIKLRSSVLHEVERRKGMRSGIAERGKKRSVDVLEAHQSQSLEHYDVR